MRKLLHHAIVKNINEKSPSYFTRENYTWLTFHETAVVLINSCPPSIIFNIHKVFGGYKTVSVTMLLPVLQRKLLKFERSLNMKVTTPSLKLTGRM